MHLLVKKEEFFDEVDESFGKFHWSLELLVERYQTSRLYAILYFSFSKLYEEVRVGPGYTYATKNLRFRCFAKQLFYTYCQNPYRNIC